MSFANTGSGLQQQVEQTSVSFAASGDNIVIANSSNNGIVKIYRVSLTIFAATTLQFKGGAQPVRYDFSTSGAMVLDYSFANMSPWYSTLIGANFVINNSNAVQISGGIDYAIIPVIS